MTADIPPEVRDFVLAHIPSVAHMEALALVVEESGPWPPAALARRLYIAEGRVVEILRDFQRTGLLETSSEARLRSADPRVGLVQRTVRFYRERLVPMTLLIHQGDPASQIADAFTFRKR